MHSMHQHGDHPASTMPYTRREMLQRCGMGIGGLGLASLCAEQTAAEATRAATNPLAVKPPHFAGKARQVVHLFMNGGPSQVDT